MAASNKALSIAALAALSLSAATQASVSDPALIIHAQAGLNIDTFTVPLALLAAGAEVGSLQYNLPAPLFLPNTGTWVQSLNLSYVPENAVPVQDNLISLGFTLWTGGATTNFVISTGEFGIAPNAVIARGSANVGVTDGAGQNFPDGIVQYIPSNGGFLTQTNGGFGIGPVYAPSGTPFALLGPGPMSTGFGSISGGNNVPATVLGAPASDMSAQWRFSLTGNDQIGVTSTFFSSSIIPAPGAAALLAFGGLVATRRRR
jgi:hypothetical protein